jgi:hypothetical protein
MASSPLYDIFDPDEELRRKAELHRLLTGERMSLTDLMPEEEKSSLLDQLSNAGSSGLATVGWIFDTPGAMVRGALSGGLPKGLSALWESSDDRVDGRELLRQYGLVGAEDNWSNWAGSLAAEVALDPFSWVNPLAIAGRGALTTTGKALQRSGMLGDAALYAKQQGKGIREYLRNVTGEDVLKAYANGDAVAEAAARETFADAASALGVSPEDLLSQKAAGSMEFRVPGMKRGYNISLTGGRLGDLAARTVDRFGEGLKTNALTGGLVNRARALFDTSVMGAIDPADQWRNREAYANTAARQRSIRGELEKLRQDAMAVTNESLGPELSNFNSVRIQNAIADLVEAGGDVNKLIDSEAGAAVLNTPAWSAVVKDYSARTQNAMNEAVERGLKLPANVGEGGTQFFPSQSVWFEDAMPPEIRDAISGDPMGGREARRYTKGARALSIEDNMGRSRNPSYDLPMRRQAFRQLMTNRDGVLSGKALQDRLIAATDAEIPGVIDEAWAALNQSTGGKMGTLYGSVQDSVAKSEERLAELAKSLSVDGLDPSAKRTLEKAYKEAAEAVEAGKSELVRRKKELGGRLLRNADTQFAAKGLGLFDRPVIEDMLRYDLGRARVSENANVIENALLEAAQLDSADQFAGGGYVSLAEAAKKLGFDERRFAERFGTEFLEGASVSQSKIDSLAQLAPTTGSTSEGPLASSFRKFTNMFKVGALANPAYHSRNAYSGNFATMTQGLTSNPLTIIANAIAGARATSGTTDWLLARARKTPRYQRVAQEYRRLNPAASAAEVDAEILRQFNADAARNGIAQPGELADFAGIAPAGERTSFVGEGFTPFKWFGKGSDFARGLKDWTTVRGVDVTGMLTGNQRPGPAVTRNPVLELHERVGRRVEDANRFGAYLTALQKGYSPDAAAEVVYRSQVDYRPSAFTAGEQKLKGYMPFYSYTRGITPLIAENMLYRPGGLQQQSIRAITRGGQGDEEYFVPEHLRQSAAIPIPGATPGEGIQRFVTNIDLPYAGVLNLFSPGVGGSATERVLDSARRTGMNIAGQLNPLYKLPLEYLFNRQLYTGRELSDLYSVLEQDIGPWGRPLENAFVNLFPGGSKLDALYRASKDDRISSGAAWSKGLVNMLTGIDLTDVDQEKARSRAARDVLTKILDTTAGAKAYENITVPEDVLTEMTPDQQQLYLLYRIMQSEAAKRARERKAAATQDPLAILGVQ